MASTAADMNISVIAESKYPIPFGELQRAARNSDIVYKSLTVASTSPSEDAVFAIDKAPGQSAIIDFSTDEAVQWSIMTDPSENLVFTPYNDAIDTDVIINTGNVGALCVEGSDNGICLQGSAIGNPVKIKSDGIDTDISIQLIPKGFGEVLVPTITGINNDNAAATKKYVDDQVVAGSGDVVGPASANNNAIARFDTGTGKLIKNSNIFVDDSGNITGVATLTSTFLGGTLTTPVQTSITEVGTLTNGTWNAAPISVQYGGTGATTLTSGNVLVGAGVASVTTSKAAPVGDFVGTTDTQTLSGKTLTTPVISSISNVGLLTLPTSTDTLVGRSTTDSLTNKSLVDTTVFYDNATSTKQMQFELSGITPSTTQILTVPDASGTLTLTDTLQTLTNKTIDGSLNTITISTTDITSGVLGVSNGGTGTASLTSGNVLVGAGVGAVVTTKAAPSGDFVGTTDVQTLTNKTLGTTTITGVTAVTDTTQSTSTLDGALVVSGGVGISKDVYIGGVTRFLDDVSITMGKVLTIDYTPTAGTDAVNKSYVDSVGSGLIPKDSVVVATTGVLETNNYSNGVSGVGATLTKTVAGAFPLIDSSPLGIGQRILVKDEASALKNGIYTLTTVGDGLTPWQLTRATDNDTTTEFVGAYVFISSGTINGFTSWVCTNSANPVVGTDSIIFSQFSAANTAAGANLGAGQQVYVNNTGTTLNFRSFVGTTNRITVTQNANDLTLNTGSEIGLTTNSLNQFASTTSTQLRSVISDETGTGSLVFSNSPTLTTPSISSIINTGTLTLPTGTTTLVGINTTNILTNKTLTSPTISTIINTGTLTLPTTTTTLIGTNTTNTLTNKTLTSPTISSIVNTGTLTLPTTTTTLVGTNTTNTLTNKTLTSSLNNVTASGLFAGSGSTTIAISAATAPTVGQVLTATSAVTANWQSPGVVIGTAFATGTPTIGAARRLIYTGTINQYDWVTTSGDIARGSTLGMETTLVSDARGKKSIVTIDTANNFGGKIPLHSGFYPSCHLFMRDSTYVDKLFDGRYNAPIYADVQSQSKLAPGVGGYALTGATGNFGRSIGMDYYGQTLVVGGPLDNSGVGAAWFYNRGATTAAFTEVGGSKIVGTGAAGTAQSFGSSVAVSSDNTTVVIGAPTDGTGGTTNYGAIWVFNTVGLQLGSKLVGTGSAVGGERQGTSVAISSNADTIAVSGDGRSVWVYYKSAPSTWTEQERIAYNPLGSPPSPAGSWGSVALSSDGHTLAIGSMTATEQMIYVYERNGGPSGGVSWVLVDSFASLTGYRIAMSGDASTIIATNSTGGFANVFKRTEMPYDTFGTERGPYSWVQNIVTPNGSPSGGGLAISEDGSTIIIGDAANEGVYIYLKEVGGLYSLRGIYPQTSYLVSGTGGVGSGSQGLTVATSGFGNVMVVGGQGDNTNVGAAWIFK